MVLPRLTAKADPGKEAHRSAGGKIYLYPGHLFVSTDGCAATTILGSCVAVCLWDGGKGVGGLNHYQLPYWAGVGQASPRYGNVAVEHLWEELLEAGAGRGQLQAKLFGGAGLIGTQADGHHLGAKNVEMARELLATLDIPVVSEDVGGRKGRKLIFHTDTGVAWVRKL